MYKSVLESAKVALLYDWFFYRGPNQITCIGMYARTLLGSWHAVRCGELNAIRIFQSRRQRSCKLTRRSTAPGSGMCMMGQIALLRISCPAGV
jgi:hypothetical protein